MSVARRSLQVVAFVCTLIVGVTSMAVIVTQTTWFKEWLRGFIVRQAEDYVNGRLSIGRLDGNLFYGVEMEDVDVTMNGKTVVGIKDLGLDYNVFTFLKGNVVLDHIRLNKPQLVLEKTADGWNLASLIKVRTPKNQSSKPIEIGEIGISDGSLALMGDVVGTSGVDVPSQIDKLDASIGVKSDADDLQVNIAHVSLRAANPDFGINSFSGVIRRTKRDVTFENVSLRTEESSLRINGAVKELDAAAPIVSVKASSDKLTLDEIAKIVPALRGYHMQPALEIAVNGPMDRLAVDLNAREATVGNVIGDLTVDAAAPGRRVGGTVKMAHFNVGPVAKSDTLKSDISGQARIDFALPEEGRPLHGTYAVNAGDVKVAGYEARNVVADGRIDGDVIRVNAKADAYGGKATATGTVKTATPLALDLRGHAADLDLRNLPPALNAPGVPSNLDVDYAITGRGSVFSGEVRFDSSTLAGAMIAPNTTAQFRVGEGAPSYSAKGQVTGLDVQQIGRGFAIQSLSADRYHSRINASFDVTGSGGGRYPLTLDATGTAVDSSMFGASFPTLDFATNISSGNLRVKAVGQFANLDPAVVANNDKIAGMLSGDVNVDTTIRDYSDPITVDSIDASGRVNLTQSTIAKLEINTATIDGQFANRAGTINELSIASPDLTVKGQGPLALDESGASNLTLHVEAPALDRIGMIVDQPLTGGAIVDATVNGNGRELIVYGTMTGSDLGQGENNALALNSNFDATIPQLDTAEMTVHANTSATFVKVGGQEINAFTADTTFRKSNLIFSATARQEMRQLDAGGNVIFHPDHQEIHLPDLMLRSQGVEWRTEPGSQGAIQYGKDRIAVENFTLVNGMQRITAEGALGSPSETLQVKMEAVDVSQLNQLMLRDPQELKGLLSANATISGETKSPDVKGEFMLTQGAFKQFMFESLGGTVGYATDGLTLDVRLQQNASAWLTAKGHAPATLFKPTPDEMGGEHIAAAPGEAVDIQVESSKIDLGVVQGFTSAVNNVKGSLQANLKVTGSGYDPHLDGTISIQGGAFAVPDLGTSYTGLDTQIRLEPDAVRIGEMKIVDNHGSALTIGGELSVHGRDVGGVDISLQAHDFKVIDNKMGNMRVNTDVHVTGEVRKPRVVGNVDVSTGTIDVAKLLEQFGSSAYSTEATKLPGEDEGGDAAERVKSNAEIPADADAKKPAGGADTAPHTTDVARKQADAPKANEAPAPTPSAFEALDLNLAVGVPDDLVLKGQDIRVGGEGTSLGNMNITVGGNVQVQKVPFDVVRLTGEVHTIRGTYVFQGRRLEIMRDGRIQFIGGDEIDPNLDIEARRVVNGVEAFIKIRGSMRMPELSFHSNPPLDEADVLSLIVFNQSINELGEGQQVSLAQRAGDLAGGYLASGLTRSIGNALNLSEFEIQATGENGAGPSVTLGQQVGKDLFFRVRQAFGNEQATEFILEYQLARYLRLQAQAAETSGTTQRVQFRRVERGGMDLIFFFSY